MTFVLDASAMIAFLRDEPGAEVVTEILFDSEARIFARALNLCEVYYDFHRAAGHDHALLAISALTRIGIQVDSSLAPSVWQAAGALKASLRRVSLADCFAIELAKRMDATILTADHHEFDVLAAQPGYSIRFIR